MAGQQLARAVRPRTYYGYVRNMMKTLEAERGVQFKLVSSDEQGEIPAPTQTLDSNSPSHDRP